MTAPILRIDTVSKRFGGYTAVDDVTLDVPTNAFFALLGPSGCGKTTLLRMLAGFETPSAGRILIDGEDVSHVPPSRRPVNMVFQSYAVFPHMTVAENVGYGLKVSGVAPADIAPRVEAALRMVRLEGFAQRMPDRLSGGQRQRVALARALVKRPKLLLLDEPLSALDKKLREDMQLELVRLQHEVGITFVMVTHDQEEALSMASQIAVMEGGRILQLAPPQILYESPNCRFVADFIGAMNLLPVTVVGHEGDRAVVDAGPFGRLAIATSDASPGEATLAIRPEKMLLADGSSGWPGRVTQLAYYGNTSHAHIELESGPQVAVFMQHARRSVEPTLEPGRLVHVAFAAEDALLLRG